MRNILEMAKIISGYSREEALRRYEVCRDRYTDDNNTVYKNFDLVMEASMLLQRIMDIAKEEVKAEAAMEMKSQPVWVIPPKGDDQNFWLNKYGLRYWNLTDPMKTPKSILKTAVRSYYWCDRVIIIDGNRRVLEDIKLSDFIKRSGYNDWIPEVPETKVKFDEE
jgi:hypothetical protein